MNCCIPFHWVESVHRWYIWKEKKRQKIYIIHMIIDVYLKVIYLLKYNVIERWTLNNEHWVLWREKTIDRSFFRSDEWKWHDYLLLLLLFNWKYNAIHWELVYRWLICICTFRFAIYKFRIYFCTVKKAPRNRQTHTHITWMIGLMCLCVHLCELVSCVSKRLSEESLLTFGD